MGMVSENRGNGQKTVQRMGAWTCKHVCIGTDFAGADDTWQRTLTEAVTLWKIFLVIVSIVIMVILIRRCGILVTVENKLENKKKKANMENHFGILAAALILCRHGFRIITSILMMTMQDMFRKKFLRLCMIRF